MVFRVKTSRREFGSRCMSKASLRIHTNYCYHCSSRTMIQNWRLCTRILGFAFDDWSWRNSEFQDIIHAWQQSRDDSEQEKARLLIVGCLLSGWLALLRFAGSVCASRLRACLISPIPSNRSTVGRVADLSIRMRCRLGEHTRQPNLARLWLSIS